MDRREGVSSSACMRCPACLEDFPCGEILSFGCPHSLCRVCMENFVTKYMPLPLCPTVSCQAIISEAIVEVFLGSPGVEAFRAALLERALQEMSGRVLCPNALCGITVICDGLERQRVACQCGYPPFCSHCQQEYHYNSSCSEVQALRDQWITWLESGLEHYLGLRAGFEEFIQERTVALELASQRHRELAEDERYKAEHCRLCPHCYRPVERIDGCSSMRCGEDFHGGSQQPGCGKSFDWSTAPRYQVVIEERALPTLDIGRALLQGAECRHLFTRCALCTAMVRGPRFQCIHCESFDMCLSCMTSAIPFPHPKEHVFKVLYAPEDPPIMDMPRGTSVSVFGMMDAAVVLNGCHAEIWRYSPATGMYELRLPNGSRPVVPEDNLQPSVEDPADAQAILELALGQQEIRRFHLGLRPGSLVQVIAGVSENARPDNDTFDPVAKVVYYDPGLGLYGLQWEEPPRWPCGSCTLLNDAHIRHCVACAGAAPHSASGRFRAEVAQVQPLVRTFDEVKEIAQQHWKEKARLEKCQSDDTWGLVFSFDDHNLADELLRGIYAYGFKDPTDVQRRVIGPVLSGRDVRVHAQHGTGMSTAFLIGVLGQLDRSHQACQGLVLIGTRERAQQVRKLADGLGDYLAMKSHVVIGGGNVRHDIDTLRNGVHLAVGTPGRVYDMIAKRHLRIDDLLVFILDDADELLSRGFKDQIVEIVKTLPANVQICLGAANMPPEILNMSDKFMRDPVIVDAKRDELTLEGVRQFYVEIEKEEWKLDTLLDCFEYLTITQAIVYCNTRRKVDYIVDQMTKRDYMVLAMHAELDPRERDFVTRELRSGNAQVLISTDLFYNDSNLSSNTQGSLVIHFDLPQKMENYLQRNGQNRVFTRKRVSISFVTNNDVRTMKDIENYYHTQIEEMPTDIADMI